MKQLNEWMDGWSEQNEGNEKREGNKKEGSELKERFEKNLNRAKTEGPNDG